MAATCLRWLVKSKRRNEFDTESEHDKNGRMVEICKFCQIIEASKENNRLVLYEDEKIIAFSDIRP
jgi:hypothetical protein